MTMEKQRTKISIVLEDYRPYAAILKINAF